jgi:hypothetical protein
MNVPWSRDGDLSAVLVLRAALFLSTLVFLAHRANWLRLLSICPAA